MAVDCGGRRAGEGEGGREGAKGLQPARTEDAVSWEAIARREYDDVADDEVVDRHRRLRAAAHDLHGTVGFDLRKRLKLAVLAPVLKRVHAWRREEG